MKKNATQNALYIYPPGRNSSSDHSSRCLFCLSAASRISFLLLQREKTQGFSTQLNCGRIRASDSVERSDFNYKLSFPPKILSQVAMRKRWRKKHNFEWKTERKSKRARWIYCETTRKKFAYKSEIMLRLRAVSPLISSYHRLIIEFGTK